MPRTLSLIRVIVLVVLCTGACSSPDGPVRADKSEGPAPVAVDLAIINATLIDGSGMPPQPLATILISDGLIRQVGLGSEVDVPGGTQVIDVEGRTVLPGFINAHVHSGLDVNTLRSFAMDGVTTLRDVGYFGPGSFSDMFRNCDTLNTDTRNAHVVAAGPLITTVGGYGNYEVTSVADAVRGVVELIGGGADIIKIAIEDNLQGRTWPMLSQAEVDTIVQTAHAMGVRVAAHISRNSHFSRAISAGVDDVAHMIVESITPDLVAMAVTNNVYWVPTLELWHGVSDMYGLNWEAVAVNNLRLFHQAGGKVAVGTDFGGYITAFDLGMPMTEIRLLEAAGMTPMQIIVAGTMNAAYVCGLEDQVGTIAAGKVADIIVLSADPLSNLNALMDAVVVIHKGAIIRNSGIAVLAAGSYRLVGSE